MGSIGGLLDTLRDWVQDTQPLCTRLRQTVAEDILVFREKVTGLDSGECSEEWSPLEQY